MKLHVEAQGAGRDLVFLHGWGMNGGVWDGVSKALSKNFRLHKVDLPGHGSSPCCEGEDWVEVLSEMFPPQIDLCGWSLGGEIALLWALRHPSQVRRLALISSTPCFGKRENWEHGLSEFEMSQFAEGLEKEPEQTFKRFLLLQTQGANDAKAVFRKLHDSMEGREAKMEELRRGLDLLRELDLRDKARLISKPTLLLHGSCDRLVPIGAAIWLKHNMPDARLVEILGCAHAPLFSHSETCALNLTEFFDGP